MKVASAPRKRAFLHVGETRQDSAFNLRIRRGTGVFLLSKLTTNISYEHDMGKWTTYKETEVFIST